MTFNSKHRSIIGLALASLAYVSSVPAHAAAPGCFVSPARLGDDVVGAFLTAPTTLLTEYPTAGLQMGSRTRSLAGSTPDALDPILSLVPKATDAQKSAIGAGLARAAKACQPSAPDYALLIEQKVASTKDDVLISAFKSILDGFDTASLGGIAPGPTAAGITNGGSVNGSSGSPSSETAATQTTGGSFTAGSSARFATTHDESVSVSPSN